MKGSADADPDKNPDAAARNDPSNLAEDAVPAPSAAGKKLTHEEKEAARTGWRAEVQEIPKQRSFGLVVFALLITVFLGALDQTIVSTALPTIVEELGGASAYNWVGSAYLLTAASSAPFYGKLADVAGRKPTLIFAILLFMFGSGLCGGAKTMIWLVIARGVQGLGGGGIIQLVQITISDITTLEDRGKYTGLVGTVWGIASVLGPLVGGAIVENARWGWIFWINLPTGAVACAIFALCLRVPRKQIKTLKQHAREFDYIGFILITFGVGSFLVGLNNGETSWSSVGSIVPLVLGIVAVIGGGINEIFTKQMAIVPPRLFKIRSAAALLGIAFLHAFTFFAGAYFLPLYFQATAGASPLMAGVRTLPYSLGGSVTSMFGGFLVAKIYRNYRVIMAVALGIMCFGFGLMIMLDAYSSIPKQVFLLLVPALGMGILFPVPLIALQSAMPPSSIAAATATFGLMRTMGGAVGITAAGSIYASQLRPHLAQVSGFDSSAIVGGSAASALAYPVTELRNIQPPEVRMQVQQAYALSIRYIWIMLTPIAGVCFLLTFFVKVYSLKRNVQKEGKGVKDASDASDDATAVSTPPAQEAEKSPQADGTSAQKPDPATQV